MKFTYRMAMAMAATAMIVGWIPTINGWAFYQPQAVACWLTALTLLVTPFAYDKYGSGLKLS